MKKIKRSLGPFLGLYTSLNADHVQDPYSPYMLNVRIVDGVIRPRLGYGVLEAAQSGFTAVYGLEYIQGYNASNALIEEYVSFEHLGVAVRPYSRNVTTGAPTVITNGGVSVSLHASDWVGFTFNNLSYFINPNDTYPVWKHEITSNTSFTPMGVAPSPVASLTYSVDSVYTNQVFTGITMTNAAQCVVSGGFFNTSGSLNSSVLTDGTARVVYSVAALQTSSFKLDLSQTSGAAKDYTYNDCFQFVMKPVEPASPFQVDGSRINADSIKVSFFNTAGTEFVADKVDVVESGNASSGYTYTVRAQFVKVTRADWASTKFVKIEMAFDSIQEAGFLDVRPYTVGKVDMQMTPASEGDHRLFAYANKISTSGHESGLFGVIKGSSMQYLKIPNTELVGKNPVQSLKGLGVAVTFTMTASTDAAVDLVTLYTRVDGKWLQLTSQADGGTSPTTSTFTERRTTDDCRKITTLYSGSGAAAFDKMTCACAFKGWVVWGTKGGFQNIRHSRVGEAEQFAEDIDENLPDEDLNQGATFSLSDNYADEPLAMFPAGDALIIVGSNGVYAQVGNRPLEMTPPKKLPGSVGCANKLACCAWKDDAGNPGVAFLDRQGTGIWFAMVDQSFDGISGFRLIKISEVLGRDANVATTDLYSLMGLQTGESSQVAWTTTARLFITHLDDGLALSNGRRRILRLTQRALVDGNRQFELYEYVWSGTANDLKFKYFSSTERRGYMAIDHSGRMLMMEYDWTVTNPISFPYSGTLRDGGTSILAMTGGVPDAQKTAVGWNSAIKGGPNRRIARVRVDYDGQTEPSVSGRQLGASKYWVKFPVSSQGRELQYSLAWLNDGVQTDIGSDSQILGMEAIELQLNERVRY